eukprot:c478_g1_i1 orf=576-1343(-)
MAPPPPLHVPDSSVKALIIQHKSSTSPTSSIDSPTEPSLVPTPSPSQPSSLFTNPHSDLSLSLPSGSSSSNSLVPEITPVSECEGPRQRRKKKQPRAHMKQKHAVNLDHVSEERSKQALPRRDSADFQKKRKGCHDNVCCKCAAGFTADCAAVCCCPLALLHLVALTFIRLPTAMAWKMVVRLKNKVYTKRRPAKDREEESPGPKFANSWSYAASPEGMNDPRLHTASFDSQNLWQHFDAGSLDFGSLSMRREPF